MLVCSQADQKEVNRPAFFADAMLGRLARWLRILGYDTAYKAVLPDELLVQLVLCDNRWLLTRDRYLAKRKVLRERLTLLSSDHVVDQLQQLVLELQIQLNLDAQTPSRCAHCNLMLEPISQKQAAPNVPAFVAGQHSEFARCAGCGRVYWPGTHWAHMGAQLDRVRAR